MTALDIFSYDGAQVRHISIDGESWFVAVDVTTALGIVNGRDAIGRLDQDGVGSADVIDSMGRTQSAKTVNESGLYELIFQSRVPGAVAFKRWVTHDVLPAIRKTGTYSAPKTLEERTLELVGELHSRVQEQAAQIAVLEPAAQAWGELASADGDYEVADAAKILARAGVETGRQRLFTQMSDMRWIYRATHGKWAAYQTAVDSGYLAERAQSHHHPRTGEVVLDPPQVRVTVRGLERLRVRLGSLEKAA